MHEVREREHRARPQRECVRAVLDPRANNACVAAALAANVALFAYSLYKIITCRRNPITGVLYCELAEFRTIVREHCDDRDKYFLVDRIPETHAELGFEPDSPTPPADGYAATHSGSETSLTTPPEHSSKPEDSDLSYTPNYEEPL